MKTKRVALSRLHHRHATTEPPAAPPDATCPRCNQPLKYVLSQVGGVNERQLEQWDFLECPRCRTNFEFRQRTRKLRPCAFDIAALGRFSYR